MEWNSFRIIAAISKTYENIIVTYLVFNSAEIVGLKKVNELYKLQV